MTKFFAAIVLTIGAVSAFAQTSGVDTIQSADLRAHLFFMAADEMAGRDAMSLEGRITANYIAAHFMRLGLKPVGDGGTYFQNFNMVKAWLDEKNLVLRAKIAGEEKTYTFGTDYGYTRQSNTPADVTAPVVFLGYGVNAPEYGYNDLAPVNPKGKVAIVLGREPQKNDARSKFKGKWDTIHSYNWLKIEQLRKAGVAGILLVNEPPRRPQRTASAPTNAQAGPSPQYALAAPFWDVPVLTITQTVADELLRRSGKTIAQLRDQIDRDMVPASFDVADSTVTMRKTLRDPQVASTRNVLALLEGSDPQLKDEVVVVTGHYDHVGVVGNRIYRGADDNASGTAAVIEIAEAFVHGNVRPKRSILFMVFEAEERGLLGAFYYVDHPLIALEKTVANLNMDMIGRDEDSPTWPRRAPDTRNDINVLGTLYNPELRKIVDSSNAKVGLRLDYKTDEDDKEGWFSRSDHYPFAVKSIPQVFFNTGEHPDYHTENDRWDRINYEKMEKVTKLVFLSTLEIANAPRPQFTFR